MKINKMGKTINKEKLMELEKGITLISISDSKEFVFDGYDKSQIPKNDYSATMSWYKSSPIWTPEEYDKIRFKFMMIKLKGESRPRFLKEFEVKD